MSYQANVALSKTKKGIVGLGRLVLVESEVFSKRVIAVACQRREWIKSKASHNIEAKGKMVEFDWKFH